MKTVSLFNRAAMATALVFTGVLGSFSSASAQSAPWTDVDFTPELFESQISDYNVEVDGTDFEITSASESEYDGGKGESVVVETDTAVYDIFIFDDDYTAQDDIELQADALKDEFESVDLVDSDYTSEDGGWALYQVTDASIDEPAYWYVTVQTDVDGSIDLMTGTYGLESTFVDEITAGQDNIKLGDQDFMQDVNADDVQTMIDEAAAN